MTRALVRRIVRLPIRLANWQHNGKRLWLRMHCDRAGFLFLAHRVRGDEWRYEGCVLTGLRVRILWGMEWATQLRRYGFEVWMEPRWKV